jgi:hypothetical protein
MQFLGLVKKDDIHGFTQKRISKDSVPVRTSHNKNNSTTNSQQAGWSKWNSLF